MFDPQKFCNDTRDQIRDWRNTLEYMAMSSPHSDKMDDVRASLAQVIDYIEELEDAVAPKCREYIVSFTVTQHVIVRGGNDKEAEDAAYEEAVSKLAEFDVCDDDVSLWQMHEEDHVAYIDVDLSEE